MLFQKPEPADARHVRGRHDPARRARRSTSPTTPSWAPARASATSPATSSGSSTRIVARTGPHEVVVELAAQAAIPVINGLTLREHPCQALADVFTHPRALRRLDGRVLAFVGDGNNVYHSLALLGRALGMEVRLAHPRGLRPERADRRPGARARRRDRRPLVFGHDPPRSSAAPPSSTRTPGPRWARRPRPRSGATRSPRYQVNDALLDAAGPDAVAMHCLPAHRGEEITSAVMDGPAA